MPSWRRGENAPTAPDSAAQGPGAASCLGGTGRPRHRAPRRLCGTYPANRKTSKTNFSIFTPFGLSGWTCRPLASTHGIFFRATWCCSRGSCTLGGKRTAAVRVQALGGAPPGRRPQRGACVSPDPTLTSTQLSHQYLPTPPSLVNVLFFTPTFPEAPAKLGEAEHGQSPRRAEWTGKPPGTGAAF